MSNYDQQSRLKVTTNTQDGYFDQVLAMSSHVINDGWTQLWNTYKDTDGKYALKRIDIDEDDFGSIHADILPCKIQFIGDNTTGVGVYFYINFTAGTLTNDKKLTCDVAGWRLCVKVSVAEQKKADMTAEQAQFIDDNYTGLGDYTVARLFADLTKANFDQLIPDKSTFGTDGTGKQITFDDWKKANPKLIGQFYGFMAEWTSDLGDKGLSTLGVKVTIPSMDDQDPLAPTYPPTLMLHQGFKYENPDTDKLVAEDYDCLLYCEQILNHPKPKQTFVRDAGNWCYPAYGNVPAVNGTFAISGQVFFSGDNGILQHMQPLAALSQITLKDPTIDDTGDRYHYFDVGHNSQHEDPYDSYFLAKADLDNHRYIWTTEDKRPAGRMNKWGSAYNYCEHQAVQTVTIGWEPGSNTIKVAGKTTYNYHDSDWDNASMTNRQARLEESYTSTWEVSISVTTDDEGRLTLALGTEPQDAKVKVVQDYHHQDGYWINLQNTIEGYLSDFEKQLKQALVAVQTNLANIFKTTGQFVYPGNGVLQYKNPVFSNDGLVLAAAEYKALESKADVPPPYPGASLYKYPRTLPNMKITTGSRQDSRQ